MIALSFSLSLKLSTELHDEPDHGLHMLGARVFHNRIVLHFVDVVNDN
jgi:hypothetical protein